MTTLATLLRQALDPIPAGSTVPVEWIRGLLDEHEGPDDVDLTVQDVAAKLDRAPSTIRTWAGAGKLPGAYRLQGREWRIPRSALRTLREEPAEPVRRRDGTVDLSGWRDAS